MKNHFKIILCVIKVCASLILCAGLYSCEKDPLDACIKNALEKEGLTPYSGIAPMDCYYSLDLYEWKGEKYFLPNCNCCDMYVLPYNCDLITIPENQDNLFFSEAVFIRIVGLQQ